MLNHILFTIYFFIDGLVIINININIRARKIFCLRLSLKLFFEKILVTPEFLLMQLRVELNKIFNID